MNKLRRFLSENENFKQKNIIFIKISSNLIKEKVFLNINKSDYFILKLIFKFFVNNFNFEDNNLKIEANNYSRVNKFDHIFILSEEKYFKRYHLKKYLINLNKYAKKGAIVMIQMRNKQNIFNIFRYKKNIKKKNLTISKSLLMFDYIYFTKFNFLKFFNYFENILILNRFFFLANNIIVKYKYVPEFNYKK